MPFKADTYLVLIASPSDLTEERQVATDVINEWNSLHAVAEGVVLLPMKWETHALPEVGVRPQAAINDQLVSSSDMLIGMFWTKLGTSTGVAASGTVEEIDQFVAAGKPALLYFSSRPIDPNKIDLKQHEALRQFKSETYRAALVGAFASTQELRDKLLRDLTQQVRRLKGKKRAPRGDKLEETVRLVEMMTSFRKAKITPEDYHSFRDALLFPKKAASTTPKVAPLTGQKGPNGHRLEYLKNGDLVEWLPDDESPGEEWPMIIRRNDDAVYKAAEEFETVIWYDRKLMLQQRIAEGRDKLEPHIEKGMLEAMAKAERKYGKRKIRNYYKDDFGWGMLNGKLSALRWVMGDDWDNLDT